MTPATVWRDLLERVAHVQPERRTRSMPPRRNGGTLRRDFGGRRFNGGELDDIHARLSSGESARSIGDEYGIEPEHVRLIWRERE